jgi:hypothetical protein
MDPSSGETPSTAEPTCARDTTATPDIPTPSSSTVPDLQQQQHEGKQEEHQEEQKSTTTITSTSSESSTQKAESIADTIITVAPSFKTAASKDVEVDKEIVEEDLESAENEGGFEKHIEENEELQQDQIEVKADVDAGKDVFVEEKEDLPEDNEEVEESESEEDEESGEEEEDDDEDEEEEEDDEDDDEEDEDEEEDEEDEEPKLKYQRLAGTLSETLKKDAVSTMAVSDRFLVRVLYIKKILPVINPRLYSLVYVWV